MTKRKAAGPLIFLALLFLTVLAWQQTGCSFSEFFSRSSHLTDLTSLMFPPDTAYFSTIFKPLLVTVQMAVTGTVLGSVLALLAAPLCAASTGYPAVLRTVLRIIVQILRSFPALIIALFSTFIFGLGTFAGTFALTVFTFAIMTRLTYEDIEAADPHAFQALSVIGTPRYVNFVRTVLPQMLPSYFSNALYLLETNVRSSAILGYVGAGGIGLILNEKISWREYDRVGAIILSLLLISCLSELISSRLGAIVRGEVRASSREKKWIVSLFAALFLFCLFTSDGPDFSHTAPKIIQKMISGFLHPDWSFFFASGKTGLGYMILETIEISFLGTLLGTIPAFLLAFLGSRRIMPAWAAILFRFVVLAIRSVPFIIYGLIIIRVTGAGAFAGVLTMGMCSIGLLAKRFTQAIEALDLRAYKALRSMGVSSAVAVCRAILPQLWPIVASSILYRFDVNFREASVLGLVGAGGIGATLILAMNKYVWPTVGSIFLGIVIMVWLIDLLSGRVRKKLR